MKYKYKLSSNTWNQKEIDAINRVVISQNFTMGKEVLNLEKKFANYFGARYCVMSNSGSSANLLGIASLIYSGKLKKGDEVIVPAVSWSTTYFPLLQYGLKVKFVDIDIDSLNFNLNDLKQAISNQTRMILLVNLLGNNNDFSKISEIIKGKNIILFEDNCESMGSTYSNKYSGTFGIIGTFSSFYSHHIATMEGGYSLTNDFGLYEYMKTIRAHGWTRNLSKNSPLYTKSSDPFYEKFNFILPGYNLRPLEMEAAIGVEQLKKLKNLIKFRVKNAKLFLDVIGPISGIKLQKEIGNSSWFGFSIVLVDHLEGKRPALTKFLDKNGIEVRPIVTGNFVRNKAINYFDYSIHNKLLNADYIHDNGFFVGNRGDDITKEIFLFKTLIEKFISNLA
jgi:CDP-6-deoxy-D-xylo-4-hexulose-3-dehydrase